MDFNRQYLSTKQVFGLQAEKTLQDYGPQINRDKPVLDLGAGQGRNTFFLAAKGFAVDALDPSSVSVELIKSKALQKKWDIRPYCTGFESFVPETDYYAAVLIFGLIQILSRSAIDLLRQRVLQWTQPGSLVFITAFSTLDQSFNKIKTAWGKTGSNSFTDKDGNIRTFLKPGQVLALFPGATVLHHWEGTGPEHHHGNGILEQHEMIEAVFRI